MHKSYLFAMDPIGMFLALFYIVLLSGVLVQVAKYLKVGFSAKSLVIFYLYYYLFFIVSTFLPFVPDLSDTELFSLMITENYFPPHQSLGVRLFWWITYPLRAISFFKMEVFIVFQIFIFMLALMVFWKSWQIVLEHNKFNKEMGATLYLGLAALYPAYMLYIPLPLREFLILLGFAIMTYGIIDKYYNNSGLLAMILGSAILLFGRPQLIIIAILFLAVFQKNKWIKYTFIAGSIFLIPYVFSSVMSYSRFSPDFFMYLRNHGAHKQGILGYGIVEWKTFYDMFISMPELVGQFLLSPFPILHTKNPLQFFSIFLDAIFSIVIYLSIIYAGLKVSKVYLFIFIVSASMFAVWEYHIAGAVRHRMPLVGMLLPIASYGILKFYQDLKRKL